MPAAKSIDQAIVEFCHFARANGLVVGVQESLDSLRAAEAIGITEPERFKFALRAVMCSSKRDWDLFEDIFDDYWRDQARNRRLKHGHETTKSFLEISSPLNGGSLPLIGQSDTAPVEGEGKAVLGATAHDRLKKTDFSQLTHTDLAELERISARLLEQMSLRLSRRPKTIAAQGKINLRRTIRHGLSRGGDLIELHFRGRKLQQLKLVVVLDVSGSMNPYSIFFVRFAYTLQKYFKRVDTFLFSTQLTEITSMLRARHLRDALKSLAGHAAGWSGGTKIGDSLHELNLRHGRRLFSRDTVFMVLSDGWDTGDPEMLKAELSDIKRRVRKLIWLNPLLGMDDYQPITRGMSAALPYIDVFAPAHNLESLLNLETQLRMV